jgi:hypothetical protein
MQRGHFMQQDSRNYPVLENTRLQDAFWAWERTTWCVLAIILLKRTSLARFVVYAAAAFRAATI